MLLFLWHRNESPLRQWAHAWPTGSVPVQRLQIQSRGPTRPSPLPVDTVGLPHQCDSISGSTLYPRFSEQDRKKCLPLQSQQHTAPCGAIQHIHGESHTTNTRRIVLSGKYFYGATQKLQLNGLAVLTSVATFLQRPPATCSCLATRSLSSIRGRSHLPRETLAQRKMLPHRVW